MVFGSPNAITFFKIHIIVSECNTKLEIDFETYWIIFELYNHDFKKFSSGERVTHYWGVTHYWVKYVILLQNRPLATACSMVCCSGICVWLETVLSFLKRRSTSGWILPSDLASMNMLVPPGTLVLFRIPARNCLLIHSLNLGIKACGALKVGVFARLEGSFRVILCMTLQRGGSSSRTSLTNTLGNNAGKSGTSSVVAMADLGRLDLASQVTLTLWSAK